MKITKITAQVKQRGRYSIYVDEAYSFSLSEQALLDSHIASGQELTHSEVESYKKQSIDDKLYNRALRYIAARPRTEWEMEFYLTRKEASPDLVQSINAKLADIGLLDDAKFAASYAHDRQLLRPTSKRKLQMELRKKRIDPAIIDEVLHDTVDSDTAALREVVERKRRQTKYQDDTKLMQYLARQGFGYSDIKRALGADEDY